MSINTKKFRVREDSRVDLKKWPTRVDPVYKSDGDYQKLLEDHVKQLSSQQELLYASSSYAVLLIFQALDAAGKDGVISHVMSGVNPQGCEVHSFKHPTATEIKHDFLWRTILPLPERGKIGIFNRSYYEEVLIVRVHPEILRAEGTPGGADEPSVWDERYRSIRGLERHLFHNGTRILKFFLHLSKEEQRKRFLARIDEPEKNWKFSASDLAERAYWDDYQSAFQDAIAATATPESPWFVVPADHKWFTHLVVGAAIIEALERLDLRYPQITDEQRAALEKARRELGQEKP